MSETIVAPQQEEKVTYCQTFPETFELAENLSKKLAWLTKTIESNPVVPILENILFSKGTIFASDLQTTAMHVTSIKGEFLAPAKMLLNFVKNLEKQDKVSFSGDPGNGKVWIRVNDEPILSFPADPLNDYPQLQHKTITTVVGEIAGENDIKAIEKAVKHASKDQLRPAMTGVFLNKDHIVGTDGHVMFFKKTEDVVMHEEGFNVIIPRKAVGLIKDFDHATIKRSDSIRVEFKNWKGEDAPYDTFYCLIKQKSRAVLFKKIDERYPDYIKVVPESNHISVTFSKKDLLTTLNMAMIAANKTTHQIAMKFCNGGFKVNIQAEDLDFSTEFQKNIPAKIEFGKKRIIEVEKDANGQTVKGDDGLAKIVEVFEDPDPNAQFAIGFNAKFLIELIKDLKETEITIKMEAPNKAGLLNDYVLIMPVMLNQYV